jgi:tetratricopeptide (TPR) repeat protein
VILVLVMAFVTASYGMDEGGNAALSYQNAIESARPYNKDKELSKKVIDIIKKGWLVDDPSVEAYLNSNEKALQHFRKAAAFTECDFSDWNQDGFKLKPVVTDFLLLHNIVLLGARYQEKLGKVDDTLEMYLDDLTMAYHVGGKSELVFRMLALRIEDDAVRLMEEFFLRKDVGRKHFEKALQRIELIRKRHFPVEALFTAAKDDFNVSLQLLEADLKALALEENTKNPKVVEGFISELRSQSQTLADSFFDDLVIAARSNTDEEWARVEKKLETLLSEVRANDSLTVDIFLKELVESSEKDFGSKLARKIGLIVLRMHKTEFRKFVEKYMTVTGRLEDLHAIVKDGYNEPD